MEFITKKCTFSETKAYCGMPLHNNFYGAINGRSISADFSQLNWHAQKTDSLKRIINKVWDKTKFNPWYSARQLMQLIADFEELPADHYVLTNSSADAVYLLAQAFRTAQATVFIPTRNEYENACKANKLYLNFYLKNKLNNPPSLPGGLAFISHPNNMDGGLLEEENLKGLIGQNPNTLIVVDQTYIQYVPDAKPLNHLLKQHNNLVILESISQGYGFPGLPIGYIAADKSTAERLWQLRPPYVFNAIAIETARYVLTHPNAYKIPAEKFLQEKRSFQEKLQEIPHLEVLDSLAPFFMIRLHKGTAKEAANFLWEHFSVIVKDVSSYRGIETENIRLIARESKENFLLLKGLRSYLQA